MEKNIWRMGGPRHWCACADSAYDWEDPPGCLWDFGPTGGQIPHPTGSESSPTRNGLQTACEGRKRQDVGGILFDAGGIRREADGIRLDPGRIRLQPGRIRLEAGGIKQDVGEMRFSAKRKRLDAGSIR